MTLDQQIAAWAAEDAALLAAGKARDEYYALVRELEAAERKLGNPVITGIWFADEGVDIENSEHEEADSLAFWQAMYRSAAMNAGDRAAQHGLSINALLGRSIY